MGLGPFLATTFLSKYLSTQEHIRMHLGKGVNKISVWWKSKGTFNDYLDKKRWVGGSKMLAIFVYVRLQMPMKR